MYRDGAMDSLEEVYTPTGVRSYDLRDYMSIYIRDLPDNSEICFIYRLGSFYDRVMQRLE